MDPLEDSVKNTPTFASTFAKEALPEHGETHPFTSNHAAKPKTNYGIHKGVRYTINKQRPRERNRAVV
jgi:hypothetical protein